jgi:hypothetical protein
MFANKNQCRRAPSRWLKRFDRRVMKQVAQTKKGALATKSGDEPGQCDSTLFCGAEHNAEATRTSKQHEPAICSSAYRPKLSDPARGTLRLQPRRSRRVRCSAWLDGLLISFPSFARQTQGVSQSLKDLANSLRQLNQRTRTHLRQASLGHQP